jgi:hypothetical protein
MHTSLIVLDLKLRSLRSGHDLHLDIKVDVYSLDVRVAIQSASAASVKAHRKHSLVQCIFTQLPPNPTLLEPPERHTRTQLIHTVHPRGARFQPVRRLDSPVEVLREHGRCQSVHRIVRLSNHVVFIFEFDDNTNRTEYFFLHNLHRRFCVGEYGRFDEVAFTSKAFATNFDLCTGFFAGLDVIHDTL